jgi:hypothetical protein
MQQEMLPAGRGQANPTRCQYAQHVAVRKQCYVAFGRTHSGDHAVRPCAHLLRASPPGHPSRKISQPGAVSWICLGVSPSYLP